MNSKVVVFAIAIEAANRRRILRRLGYQCELVAVTSLAELRSKTSDQPALSRPRAVIVGISDFAIHKLIELQTLFNDVPIMLLSSETELNERVADMVDIEHLHILAADDIDEACEQIRRVAFTDSQAAVNAAMAENRLNAAMQPSASTSTAVARWSESRSKTVGPSVGWLLLSSDLRVLEADHIATGILQNTEPSAANPSLVGVRLFELVPARFRTDLDGALADLELSYDELNVGSVSTKSGRMLANLGAKGADHWCELLLYRQSLPESIDCKGSEIAVLIRETTKPPSLDSSELIEHSFELEDRPRAVVDRRAVRGVDSLTGLPERRRALDKLDKALEQARKQNTEIVVACVNVRQLGFVNHECGIEAGDAVLKELALRLQNLLSRNKIVARLGGDEFLVVLRDCDSAQVSGRQLIKALDSVLAYPISSRAGSLQLQLSVGLAAFPTHGATAMRLLSSAALALRRARFDQSSGGAWYNRQDQNLALPLSSLQRSFEPLSVTPESLKKALQSNKLELHYQPIVVANEPNRMHSVEALLRWPAQGKSLNPADLIHLAERGGFIDDLGNWVIETACERLAFWRQSQPDLCMCINLSALQLASGAVTKLLVSSLDTHRIPATAINLEITENYDLDALEYAEGTMQQLREVGFGLSLDDFGAGFARLQYLQKYPFNTLKIDRSFVSQLSAERSSKPLIAGLVQIARSFGLQTVGEGAETAEEAAILEELGCDFLQGYYSGRPTDRRELPLI